MSRDKGDKEKELNATQIGLHSIKNMLGNHQQTDLFSEHHKEFCDKYDIKLEGTIDRFGIDLTELQSRIVEGILYAFSRTAYKGNIDPTTKEQLAKIKFSGKIPSSYKYIQEIPKIRVTQSDLLEWSGVNKQSIASWSRAVEAIQELGRIQYCFYYDRLSLDQDGVPIKDKKNKWLKEEVFSVDTLFSIKEIREKNSGTLKYYEIMPSSIFLDQRESYFMFIPFNWREEVKELVGNKKASSYTFRLLLFLRYQYELKRRSKSLKAPYKIKWSPEEIAMAIKMPPSIYMRKKKRANEILDDAYSVAKRLGYLVDYERTGHLDILILKDKKFSSGRNLTSNFSDALEEKPNKELASATVLCELFHTKRLVLDPHYQIPEGKTLEDQIAIFQKLIETRSPEDIEKLICWASSQKFWCTRLSTPLKLNQHFSEAWSEMAIGSGSGKEKISANNKKIALSISKKAKVEYPHLRIDPYHKFVEIIPKNAGAIESSIIYYENVTFENDLKNILERYKKVPI